MGTETLQGMVAGTAGRGLAFVPPLPGGGSILWGGYPGVPLVTRGYSRWRPCGVDGALSMQRVVAGTRVDGPGSIQLGVCGTPGGPRGV
jgi:hypothetical protein